MRLVKSNHNIPAPELDSFPDSSSPDSSSPDTVPIPDGSSPEAGFIPVKFSPEADSIPGKLGKIKWRIIVNYKYINAIIKKTA